ncbi:TnsA endonuclease N-terminal domain-containing protein [Aliiroseovarius sediminis]|uniref:TnsA endonuclease N-terminal domain-containing protein n=1 Tax=Aliiroseovarius sediminis TaxID=2925839 RepID=UPI001F5A08AB|nr:TnsA endonuclease N-terminal domain-containing protein [Aliiroseovarius sediminis]MCI2395727.1 hypothetical protein [Aliiroseovarius sediminis]
MKDDTNHPEDLHPPLPSRATRGIPKRSKASSRIRIVACLPSHDRPRITQFESKLEQRVWFLISVRKAVWDIREQPEAFKYIGRDGRCSYHFFDFLVTLRCGRVLAVAVKPMAEVKKKNFLLELEDIRASMNSDFADEVILITDQDFTKAEALNAERCNAFVRTRNENLQQKLKALIHVVAFPLSVGELQNRLGAGAEGYRAIFLAIFDGLLSADKTKEIDLFTMVELEERHD